MEYFCTFTRVKLKKQYFYFYWSNILLYVSVLLLKYLICVLCPPLVPDAIKCENLPTRVGYDDELQSGQDPDENDEHADELPWDGFWQFVQELFWLCKPIVAPAVRVTVLRRSWRWRCWMWRSWAGVVTRGLRLWGRLDVLPNSLKHLWRRLMVEKWTFNSRATALVDIPAVSMPIACSLKSCNICGIVLCDKTVHFRVAFYCGQPKAHLCNNHAV